jgi:aconitate hydratase
MILDFDVIKKMYLELPEKMKGVKKVFDRPLTYSEKILYTHLFNPPQGDIAKGKEYANFSPDRVAMQDATAQMALLQFIMTGLPRTSVPTSVHCDHLIVAKTGAADDLFTSRRTNEEVFHFLQSVSNKYGIDFWEPGMGIIHQIVLENYAFPGGMMIGTDSHTPNAGGLGMVAIGVGGADAVDVMAGMEWELKFPQIIGIKLTGKLNGWASSKDIILKIAGMLSVKGGTGCIIEYFGDGVNTLSATGKATICNMGAELGATCSVFPYDDSMRKYLVATGRESIASLADTVAEHLTADPETQQAPDKYYDQYVEIDLDLVEPHINGPYSPDIATPVSNMKAEALKNHWPTQVSAGLIGSCTNSSYEDLSRTASVVRKAIEMNIEPRAPLYVSPGSEQIRTIAERDGIFDVFRQIDAKVFANACGPCIGQWDREGSEMEEKNTVIHSFNRNFSKRIDGNPNTHAFVASPEMVAALAIAGDLRFNPITDKLLNKDGVQVSLTPPQGFDIPPTGFDSVSDIEQKIRPQSTSLDITIKNDSDRLQFLEPFPGWDGCDLLEMPLLIKVKGKCTTDHISMAGRWLIYRGHLDNISNNFMIGAVNAFNDKTNHVLNQLTGDYGEVPGIAREYKSKNISSVIIGDENYGEGSSREHAAMEPRFLNVKAIVVKSFARIHENNLKKQGILALTFAKKDDYDKIREDDRISIMGLASIQPGKPVDICIHHKDGRSEIIQAEHTYSPVQIEWFYAGSALNLIRKHL